MKKISTIILLALSFFVFNNCSDKIVGGTNDINYISFETKIPTIVVEKGSSVNADIHAYTTQITGSERKFDINAITALTSANPTTYTIPASITVPANSNVGTLTVKVADVNLGVDPVTLALQVTAKDGLYTGNNASLTIQKHCSLNINDFVGTYTGKTVGKNGGPTHVVTSLDQSGKLQITGMGVSFLTGYWGEVITSMQTLPMNVDLATGDFTITEAPYIVTTYNGATQPVYKLSAHGNLNACSGTMYLYYDFNQQGVGSYVEYMGSQDDFTEIIKIK